MVYIVLSYYAYMKFQPEPSIDECEIPLEKTILKSMFKKYI